MQDIPLVEQWLARTMFDHAHAKRALNIYLVEFNRPDVCHSLSASGLTDPQQSQIAAIAKAVGYPIKLAWTPRATWVETMVGYGMLKV